MRLAGGASHRPAGGGRMRPGVPVMAVMLLLWPGWPGEPVGQVRAGDWPMWGRTPQRNMTAPQEKGIVTDFAPGRLDEQGRVDPATARHVKWAARLGSQSYGNVVVAEGRVFIGTNNANRRDPKYTGDRSTLYCLDEKTGRLVWQLVVPKLEAGPECDWEYVGICSSVAVEGGRVYVVTNRCEVVCLDVRGLADGNQGLTDEAQYTAGPGRPPIAQGPTDADILWRFDMRDELGVFPHNIASNSPLVVGDAVYVGTSNGVDWTHRNVPSPRSPALIALDKRTGRLLAEERQGVSRRTFHSNWCSPAYGRFGSGQSEAGQVIWGGGDGWCYGFAEVGRGGGGSGRLMELWRFDCNGPEYRYDRQGRPRPYGTPRGPSECLATPVVYEGRVYVSIGQDPENGPGVGCLSCIDPTGRGDITRSGRVWQYRGLNRSLSTVAVADGLLYAADYAGDVHCLDAATGRLYWKHATGSAIWASPLVADGKVFIGTEDGRLVILRHGRQEQVIHTVQFDAPVYATPVVANGVLYVTTQDYLYAIGRDGGGR